MVTAVFGPLDDDPETLALVQQVISLLLRVSLLHHYDAMLGFSALHHYDVMVVEYTALHHYDVMVGFSALHHYDVMVIIEFTALHHYDVMVIYRVYCITYHRLHPISPPVYWQSPVRFQ